MNNLVAPFCHLSKRREQVCKQSGIYFDSSKRQRDVRVRSETDLLIWFAKVTPNKVFNGCM
jgi:hypothetical protein